MKFYYDIDLNFNDEYINYYAWEESEHFFKVPVFKVEDVTIILNNDIKIDTEYQDIIVADGISAVALEVINGDVVYYSSLSYADEEKVLTIVSEIMCELPIEIVGKKNRKYVSKNERIRDMYIKKIKESDASFIKLFYYEMTGEVGTNLRYMKNYLLEDIQCNFSLKYLDFYDMIFIGD